MSKRRELLSYLAAIHSLSSACLTMSAIMLLQACVSLDRAAAMQPSWLEQESQVGYAMPPFDAIQHAQAQLGQLTQSWLDIQG